MNLTLISLSLSSLNNYPFTSLPQSKVTHNLKFHNLRCVNFFSTFFYSTNQACSKASFYSSTFSSFLSRVITTESQILSYQILSRQFMNWFTTIEVEKCTFYKIISTSTNGAALSCLGDAIIRNTKFQDIRGYNGGAIYSANSIGLQHCCFINVSGNEAGCITHCATFNQKMTVNFTSFYDTKAVYFGVFQDSSTKDSYTIFNFNNFTQPYASECVGCGEVHLSNFYINNCIFNQSSARVHNGCMVVYSLSSFLCQNTLFYRCSHHTNIKPTAAVLLFETNNIRSNMTDCAFAYCGMSATYTLTVTSGYPLVVRNCCFSSKKIYEISHENNLIVVQNSQFEKKCDSKFTEKSDMEIGCVETGYIDDFDKKLFIRKIIIHTLSVVISLIFAFLFMIYMKNWRCDGVKKPAALE